MLADDIHSHRAHPSEDVLDSYSDPAAYVFVAFSSLSGAALPSFKAVIIQVN